MTLEALSERLSPDVGDTFRRFPFPIALAGIATVLFIAMINSTFPSGSEFLSRLIIGVAAAAIFAVGGTFFAESRPANRRAGIVMLYVVPIAIVALFQVRDFFWVAPFALPVVGVLWVSIAAFTSDWRGPGKAEAENRFWWLNHNAITSGAIAGVAYGIIVLGVLLLGQAIFVLFNLDASTLFYKIALPAIGGFFGPLYWLSTLPRLNEYEARKLSAPDFLARAVGALGKFVLIPLLLAYAAILLLYVAQIVVTFSLPSGMLGWMVTGFVITGAATWLLLHPEFMRESVIVRFFRRWWFPITVLPLILFAVAVYVRLDAYGFTPERLLLVAAGIWAVVITAAYLLRKGDLRLIPGLAAAILLALSIGPWNLVSLPNLDQGARLSALLRLSDPTLSVAAPEWDEEQAAEARSAIYFLDNPLGGHAVLERVLLDHGIVFDAESGSAYKLMADLGYPDTVQPNRDMVTISRDRFFAIDVSATPYYLGTLQVWYGSPQIADGYTFQLEDGEFRVLRSDEVVYREDLGPWVAHQQPNTLSQPWLDYTVDGKSYRIVLNDASWWDHPNSDHEGYEVTNLTGVVFGAQSLTVTEAPPEAVPPANGEPLPEATMPVR